MPTYRLTWEDRHDCKPCRTKDNVEARNASEAWTIAANGCLYPFERVHSVEVVREAAAKVVSPSK